MLDCFITLKKSEHNCIKIPCWNLWGLPLHQDWLLPLWEVTQSGLCQEVRSCKPSSLWLWMICDQTVTVGKGRNSFRKLYHVCPLSFYYYTGLFPLSWIPAYSKSLWVRNRTAMSICFRACGYLWMNGRLENSWGNQTAKEWSPKEVTILIRVPNVDYMQLWLYDLEADEEENPYESQN